MSVILKGCQPKTCSAACVSGTDLCLSSRELVAAGEALFGAHWREELAERLGVTRRYVLEVENNRITAPAAWRAELIALAQNLALQALETASNLLWGEESAAADAAAGTPQSQRYV